MDVHLMFWYSLTSRYFWVRGQGSRPNLLSLAFKRQLSCPWQSPWTTDKEFSALISVSVQNYRTTEMASLQTTIHCVLDIKHASSGAFDRFFISLTQAHLSQDVCFRSYALVRHLLIQKITAVKHPMRKRCNETQCFVLIIMVAPLLTVTERNKPLALKKA